MLARVLLPSLLLVASLAHADPVILRMSAIAPDGTSWARELKAWARQVEAGTNGQLKVKWVLGGIAGDEPTALARVARGQLDGAAGALMCEQLAPSLRILRLPGLVRTREEALHLLNQLHPEITAEMAKNGFNYMGAAGFGLDVLFTRKPVTSLEELRHTRLWMRQHDDVLSQALGAMGIPIVVLPIEEAARAYDEGRLDGFVASPASALSFQWASQARAFTDVKLAYLVGCVAIATRAMDPLPQPYKEQLATQSAVLASRFEAVGRDFDRQLLDKLFVRQGLNRVAPSAHFLTDLGAAESAARSAIDSKLLAPALVARATAILDAFRRAQGTEAR